MRLFQALLNLIAPQDLSCAVCGSERGIVKGTGLCSKCINELEGEVLVQRIYRDVLAYAAISHVGKAKTLVYGLKFGGRGHHAYVLSSFMYDAIRDHVQEDVILVPVPQHYTGYLKRGFNPSVYLAKELSRRMDAPVVRALKKIRRTTHQTKLSGRERRENLQGAFAMRDKALVAGKHVLLVDDVLTTGATCQACVIPLLAAGAASVTCITATHSIAGGDRV